MWIMHRIRRLVYVAIVITAGILAGYAIYARLLPIRREFDAIAVEIGRPQELMYPDTPQATLFRVLTNSTVIPGVFIALVSCVFGIWIFRARRELLLAAILIIWFAIALSIFSASAFSAYRSDSIMSKRYKSAHIIRGQILMALN
jgi:hypothetical protein